MPLHKEVTKNNLLIGSGQDDVKTTLFKSTSLFYWRPFSGGLPFIITPTTITTITAATTTTTIITTIITTTTTTTRLTTTLTATTSTTSHLIMT